MANLLNFNMNRELGFSTGRSLQFDPNRALGFDTARPLTFDSDRGLSFGKRGVVFRGFVCANCGALSTPEDTECDECGAVFEEPERNESRIARKAPAPTRAPQARPAPAPRPAPVYAPPAPPGAAYTPAPSAPVASQRFCTSCGARSWSGDAFCWNCGARFAEAQRPAGPASTTESVRLPAKKARKVLKDWQETGKTLSEYAEEK